MTMTDTPASVYIHVPYCQSHCSYCDFYSVICRPDLFAIWQDGIRQELDLLRFVPDKHPLKSVYYGGGTPSVLDPELMAGQLRQLQVLFGYADDIEITLEVKPESVTRGKAGMWRAAGFNRASIGLQSADARLLRILGRTHSADDFSAAFADLRAAGFQNISADIMFGVPGQSMDMLEETITFLLAHHPEHISFYALSLEPGTPLYETYAKHFPNEDEERLEREMYWQIRKRLSEAGFTVYEISNAARAGFQAVHNLVYWRAERYFGLGPAAASYAGRCRRQHPASLDEWYQAVRGLAAAEATLQKEADFTAAAVVETVSQQDARKEFMMLGLRLSDGVSLDQFAERFGAAAEVIFAPEIDQLFKEKLAVRRDRRLVLTPHGIDFANRAFRLFV